MLVVKVRQIHPIYPIAPDNTDVFQYSVIIRSDTENTVRVCGFAVLFFCKIGFHAVKKERAGRRLRKTRPLQDLNLRSLTLLSITQFQMMLCYNAPSLCRSAVAAKKSEPNRYTNIQSMME